MKSMNNRIREILRLESKALKKCADTGERIELIMRAGNVGNIRGIQRLKAVKKVYSDAVRASKKMVS